MEGWNVQVLDGTGKADVIRLKSKEGHAGLHHKPLRICIPREAEAGN